ncbi:hypothetical protein CEXT_659311 [Caerostris extrusa]|uniref:Uncharacterized protein n=1 Tax=Caerostris extrusa TaxID=172846 RepID=A0AAV4XKP9_CAEEX|nr:hypothetical protein CEXT_659311 [Caerostris extrusa]
MGTLFKCLLDQRECTAKIINQHESWSHSAEMVIKGSWEQRANQRDRMKNYLYNTAMEIVMNSPCKTCYRDAKGFRSVM